MTDHTGSTTGDRAGAGPADIAELGLVATVLADVARPVTLRHFRSARLNAEDKGGPDRPFDPVTVADRDAETAMRTALARLRPDDGIEGEEFPAVASTTGLIWSLDPIDGTRAYLAGAPMWGTLVAVGDRDGPLLGLIDQPWIGERFFGAPGEAWVEGPHGRRDMATRATGDLSQAILLTTFPEVGTPAERAAFDALSRAVRLTRYGLDCYGYGLVAAGHCDLVVEAGLRPWDIQAPMAVIAAAGGVVTDWRGGPAHRGGRVVAAANPTLHAAALAILERAIPSE